MALYLGATVDQSYNEVYTCSHIRPTPAKLSCRSIKLQGAVAGTGPDLEDHSVQFSGCISSFSLTLYCAYPSVCRRCSALSLSRYRLLT